MFNPFLENLTELTDNELYSKTSEITKKYWATANPQLRQQIKIIIDQLVQEQQERLIKQKQNPTDDDSDLDNLININ